jgi:hypothetical protein
VQWRCGTPAVVTKYALTSAKDFPGRDPLNWTLRGSNDGAAWTTLDARTAQEFPKRLQKREFTFQNAAPFTFYRLDFANHGEGSSQLAEWELVGAGGGGGGIVPPVPTWTEHWFEHNQNLTLKYFDDDVAVYFDSDVAPDITWMNKYLGDVWRYTKKTYGQFGSNQLGRGIFLLCKNWQNPVAEARELRQRFAKTILHGQRRFTDIAPAAHVPFAKMSGCVTRFRNRTG